MAWGTSVNKQEVRKQIVFFEKCDPSSIVIACDVHITLLCTQPKVFKQECKGGHAREHKRVAVAYV